MRLYDDEDAPFDEWGPPHHHELPELPKIMVEHNPTHTPRSGLALRLTREAMGLSAQDIATWLGVNLRTAQRWETLEEIPGFVESSLHRLLDFTRLWRYAVEEAAQVAVYRRGWREVDGMILPESWWHVTVGRALENSNVLPVRLS